MDGMEAPIEVNERVSLTVRETDGDIDSGVGNDLSLSSSLDLENSITVLNPNVQSKIISKVQRAMSDWDSYESELTGVLNQLDGIMEQVKEVGKETDKMIERNCKKAESLNGFLDDLSSVIMDPGAPVALQSKSDVVHREVTSCWETKQIQSAPENETKLIASRTCMSSLPQKTVKDHIGHEINCPKDPATTSDIQKMLLAANERTQSPSFYETRVKVAVNNVHLEIDEKSVPLKATKRAAKKGKGKSETGQPLLSKQEALQKPGFKDKNCTNKLTKDALPPIARVNRNEKYMQTRDEMYSTQNDHQKSSKKRMANTVAVDSVQKQEKKVPRTTLDYCEARLARSGCQKSAELPPIHKDNKRPPINNRLGEDMGVSLVADSLRHLSPQNQECCLIFM